LTSLSSSPLLFLQHEIIISTQEFLENRKKLALIIKAQSIARGWLVRKRFKNICKSSFLFLLSLFSHPLSLSLILSPAKETFNTLRSRNQVFGELLKTEHQYKESIETIIKDYLEPVRSSLIEQKPLMETQDTAIVFCNIETIHQTHSKIIESLNELTSDWPFVDGVGQVFLRIVCLPLPLPLPFLRSSSFSHFSPSRLLH
jgi:hypothetical protein